METTLLNLTYICGNYYDILAIYIPPNYATTIIIRMYRIQELSSTFAHLKTLLSDLSKSHDEIDFMLAKKLSDFVLL